MLEVVTQQLLELQKESLLYSCIRKYSEAYQETVWLGRIEWRSTNSRSFPVSDDGEGSSQVWATKRFWVSSEGCTGMNAVFRQMMSHCWSNTKLMWKELEWRSCKNAKVFIYCDLRIPSNKEFCMQTLGQRRLISGIKRHTFFFWSSCYLLSLVLEVLVWFMACIADLCFSFFTWSVTEICCLWPVPFFIDYQSLVLLPDCKILAETFSLTAAYWLSLVCSL